MDWSYGEVIGNYVLEKGGFIQKYHEPELLKTFLDRVFFDNNFSNLFGRNKLLNFLNLFKLLNESDTKNRSLWCVWFVKTTWFVG